MYFFCPSSVPSYRCARTPHFVTSSRSAQKGFRWAAVGPEATHEESCHNAPRNPPCATTPLPNPTQAKEQRGMRRFRRRGLTAVATEWMLAAIAYNIACCAAKPRRTPRQTPHQRSRPEDSAVAQLRHRLRRDLFSGRRVPGTALCPPAAGSSSYRAKYNRRSAAEQRLAEKLPPS